MGRFLELSGGDLPVFLLVLFRVSGVLLTAPVLGNQALPLGLKAFLAVALSAIFLPLLGKTPAPPEPSGPAYLAAVALELGVGLLIGFAASLLFAGVQFAGHLLDQELGLLAASLFDPVTDQPVSIVGQFKILLAMVVWLLVDGHHFLVSAILESFTSVPLLGFRWSDGVALTISDTLLTDMLRMGFTIAAPALFTLFLITIAMAFMARTVPEMNIFSLGFPLRMVVGFAVVALGVSLFVEGFRGAHEGHMAAVREFMRLMGGGS